MKTTQRARVRPQRMPKRMALQFFFFHRREFGEELDSGGKRGAEKFFHDTGSFRS